MEYEQTDEMLLATEEEDDTEQQNIVQSSLLIKETKVSSEAGFGSSKFNREKPTISVQNLMLFNNSKTQEYAQVTDFHGNDDNNRNSKSSQDDRILNSPSLPSTSTKKTKQPIRWSHVKEQFLLIFRMGLPYFQESSQGRWLVTSLLFFLLMNNGMYIFFSFVNRDFWSALANQNASKFYSVMVLYFATLLLLMAPINAWYTYQREQLVLHWRSWLTQRTLKLYTNHQVYYHMEMKRYQMVDNNGTEDWNRTWMDNPDQRITEDVKAFTDLSIQLCFELCDNIIQVGSFSAILWTIDSKLLGMALIYAVGGTIVTTMLGHPLIQLNVEHLQREADLRYSLVRFREHAEAIAFYLRAATLEHDGIAKRLQKVVANQYRINLLNRTLNLFTYVYSLSHDIIPVIIVAPQYFIGKIEMGVINQSTSSFATVVTSLSAVVYSFGSLSVYAANVERLSGFYHAMVDVDTIKQTYWSPSERTRYLLREATAPSPPSWNNTLLLLEEEVDIEMPTTYGVTTDYERSEQFQDYSGKYRRSLIDLQRQASEGKSAEEKINHKNVLQLKHLDLVTPDQKLRLIHDLNVNVSSGQHLLICGASGVGKSSLLRAIAGLWRTGHGSILRPADEDISFLPQQPYCTSGSLRDQLLYPASMHNVQEHPDEITNWSFQSEEFIPEDSRISSSSRPIQANIADEELIRILEQINLIEIAIRAGDGNPMQGLNVVMDWSHVLSLGEKQRLAFGRLLVHRPKRLVVLDEATSALDLYNEKCMYRILQEIAADRATSMTYVSVGHRPSLAEFHNMRLELGKSAEDDNTTENIPSVY